MEKFKVVIVEDVKLELKGTEEIFRHEIPNAEVIGTAMTEEEFWKLMETCTPDMVLLDLGLGGSTTIGVEICARLHRERPELKVLIFTGEILNEKLWVDALRAGAVGIILKTGELLTATDVQAVMDGKKLVFNEPILEKSWPASCRRSKWNSAGRKPSSTMTSTNTTSACCVTWHWATPRR